MPLFRHPIVALSALALGLIFSACAAGTEEAAELENPSPVGQPTVATTGPDASLSPSAPRQPGPDLPESSDAAPSELPMPERSAACERGKLRASQVVMIGDSFYHITQIPQRLWESARKDGALAEQEEYRHYYLSGAMMAAASLIAPIPSQYDDARNADPNIELVIMSGGGNDVLIGDRSCLTQAPPQNQSCTKTIDNAIAATQQLFAKMAQDGVKNVVYAFYPHMPTFGLFQGDAPAINQTIDYAVKLARDACESNPSLPCVFVSTVEAFEGHEDYLNAFDVHASPAGSKVAADLIWSAMKSKCLAQ